MKTLGDREAESITSARFLSSFFGGTDSAFPGDHAFGRGGAVRPLAEPGRLVGKGGVVHQFRQYGVCFIHGIFL